MEPPTMACEISVAIGRPAAVPPVGLISRWRSRRASVTLAPMPMPDAATARAGLTTSSRMSGRGGCGLDEERMLPHPSPPPGPGRLTVHRTTAEPALRTSQTFTQPPALEFGPTANNRRGISAEWARTVSVLTTARIVAAARLWRECGQSPLLAGTTEGHRRMIAAQPRPDDRGRCRQLCLCPSGRRAHLPQRQRRSGSPAQLQHASRF
jgi:hypothetical protein